MGRLTFSGIRGLLLATQNGPIDLGSEISFSGLHDLTVYARGVGSDLTLSSAISGLTHTTLIAQQDIIIAGTALDSQALNITAGSDINVGLNDPVTIDSSAVSLLVDTSAIGSVDNGGNITFQATQDLTINGPLSLLIANNDGGHIGTGGNIFLNLGGNLSTAGFSLLVTNYGDVFGSPGTSTGTIGNGGNILVQTSRGLTADYVDAFIDNRNGASIGSSATLSLNIGGALTTHIDAPAGVVGSGAQESLSLLLSNRFDTTAGGTIAGNAIVNLSAASVSAGGLFELFLSNRSGSIGGSGLLNCNVSGALAFQEFGNLEIGNEDLFNTGHGGTIHRDAAINLSAGSISTPQELDLLITNRGANDPNTGALTGTPGGMIGGNALINVNTGSLSGDLFAQINNRTGSIVSDAAVNVTATSISSAGTTGIDLSVLDRDVGSIGGSAAVSLNVSGSITSGTAGFFIGDAFGSDGPGGGTVGKDSLVVMGAGSVSTSGFFEAYNNVNGGAHIHGNAINTVAVIGDLTAQQGILATIEDTGFTSSLTFGAASHIDGNALLTLSAQNITTTSTATGTPGIDTMALEASIYPNVAGTVGGDAIINVSATQNISAPGHYPVLDS